MHKRQLMQKQRACLTFANIAPYAAKYIHMTTHYSASGVYRFVWLLTPGTRPNAMEIK